MNFGHNDSFNNSFIRCLFETEPNLEDRRLGDCSRQLPQESLLWTVTRFPFRLPSFSSVCVYLPKSSSGRSRTNVPVHPTNTFVGVPNSGRGSVVGNRFSSGDLFPRLHSRIENRRLWVSSTPYPCSGTICK